MDTVKRGIQSRYPLPCEKLFAARVLDIIDAAVQSGRTRFTAFLDLNQRRIAAELAKALNVPVRYWGGYEDAERAVASFSPVNDCEERDWPVSALMAVPSDGAAGHRDILGALIGAGLDRSALGDIVKTERGFVIFLSPAAAQYVTQNLSKAGKSALSLCPLSRDEAASLTFLQELVHLRATVSSPRADAVVAALCGVGRSQAARLVESGRVFADARPVAKPSALLTGGEIISVRGAGRFRLIEIGPRTRKGRLALSAVKYR